MTRTNIIICFFFASASVLHAGALKSTVAGTVTDHHHRHRQNKGNHGSNAIDIGTHHARRIRSSRQLHGISRGGGKATIGSSSTSSTPASPKLLQSMRLLYLTYYASLGALLPYLPVYFHSLGHPGSSIGVLGAVKVGNALNRGNVL